VGRSTIAAVAFAALCGVSVAGTPRDAVTIALGDAAAHEHDAEWYRYLWFPAGSLADHKAVGWALNECVSRSSFHVHPKSFGEGDDLGVMRIDLRDLGDDDETVAAIARVWEGLAVREPYFLTNVGSGVDVEILERRGDQALIASEPWTNALGVTYTKRWVPAAEAGKRVSRVYGSHVDATEIETLAVLTGSAIPIARAEWFTRIATSNVDGGAYYEFRGITQQTETEFLEAFVGVDTADIERLGSDKRAATFRSGVTKKPRQVEFFTGPQTRFDAGAGVVSITRDLADDDQFDPAKHPVFNLLDPKFDASEIILEDAKGHHVYAIFDGQGNIAREVGSNVATDSTIPDGHPQRLQPAISCIRCHARKPHDGWRLVENDVAKLWAGGYATIGDLSEDEDAAIALRKLFAQYQGDPEKMFRRARIDYHEASVRSTAGMNAADAANALVELYRRHWFDPVTPAVACEELGIDVPDGSTAVAELRSWCGAVDEGDGLRLEHPTLAALKSGLDTVGRVDWEAVFVDAAERVDDRRRQLALEEEPIR
jgi:hypothetical protein